MMSSTFNRAELLATMPLFSYLTREELETLQALFVEETRLKGDVVCQFGDEGDTFYVVVSGELEVWSGGTEERLLNRLDPGDFFGEMALVLGGKRTTTVMVSQRAQLLVLNKASFTRFLMNNAKVQEYFARVLCQRLAGVVTGVTIGRSTKIISVVGHPGLSGKTLIARVLAGLLVDFTGDDVLLVRLHPPVAGRHSDTPPLLLRTMDTPTEGISRQIQRQPADPAVLDVALEPGGTESVYGALLSDLTIKLGHQFPWIVFDLGDEPDSLLKSVDEFSDIQVKLVNRLSAPAPSPNGARAQMRTFQVIDQCNPHAPSVPINACEPFVIPVEDALKPLTPDQQVDYLRRHPLSKAAIPLHRLARKILGKTVGVALGGGAAFGLAHIGVLHVLQENGIPIDLLAGCSIGSLIAINYAAGNYPNKMIAQASELWSTRNLLTMMDFSLTKPGLLAGDRIIEMFAPVLNGVETFDDLLVPCRVTATDIETGERVALMTGRLDFAYRASCSVPMVWSPVQAGERALVDGGVADPVPAEVIREMGADICIAVNVVPRLKKGVETVLSQMYRQVNRFNPLAYLGKSQNLPSTFDTIMNSIQTLQHELGNFKAITADIRINPDLSDFTWIEFYRYDELIERGREAAKRALPSIKKRVNIRTK